MITTQLNHKENRPNRYEKTVGISLTVPNQALTIREILTRSGVIDVGRSLYYDEEPDHENVDPTSRLDFDLSQSYEISQEISERSRRRQAEAKALSEEAKAKQSEAKADEPKPKPKAKVAESEEE